MRRISVISAKLADQILNGEENKFNEDLCYLLDVARAAETIISSNESLQHAIYGYRDLKTALEG